MEEKVEEGRGVDKKNLHRNKKEGREIQPKEEKK